MSCPAGRMRSTERVLWRMAVLVASLMLMAAPSPGAELTDQQVLEALAGESPRDAAIRKGLEYLRARQRADGAVTVGGDHLATALTSLAVMAHLAAGTSPDDEAHGPWMRRSIRCVITRQDADGYFGARDGSRMYGHGITTLMLAEALGMCRDEALDERIRVALERAVAVTVAAARVPKPDGHQGGWRYTPQEAASDLSLSGWQLMSLHACQQVGIAVPEQVVRDAVAYGKRLTTADGKVGYQAAGQDHPSLRGLGMLCFAIGGEQEAKEVPCIAARIAADPIAWQGAWFFYRAYYDAVGLSRAAPEVWDAYGPKLEKLLVDHQNADGSWPNPPGDDEGQQGPVYMTSMALLALTVNRHVLPAYQR